MDLPEQKLSRTVRRRLVDQVRANPQALLKISDEDFYDWYAEQPDLPLTLLLDLIRDGLKLDHQLRRNLTLKTVRSLQYYTDRVRKMSDDHPEVGDQAGYILFEQQVLPEVLHGYEIPARLLTVADLQPNVPIRYFSMQTFGGKDDEGNDPPLVALSRPKTFTPNGSLEHRRGNHIEVKKNWLRGPGQEGPYPADFRGSSKDFYTVLGKTSEDSDGGLQVCSDPPNILSLDCMDEVNAWVPLNPFE